MSKVYKESPSILLVFPSGKEGSKKILDAHICLYFSSNIRARKPSSKLTLIRKEVNAPWVLHICKSICIMLLIENMIHILKIIF